MENVTTPETWMDEARQIAAQCWCDEETKHVEMNPALAEAVAKRIAVWMDTGAQHCRNECYYRSLVVRCGDALGDAAKTCDDGSKSEDVLCAKVPELVEALVSKVEELEIYKEFHHKVVDATVGDTEGIHILNQQLPAVLRRLENTEK